MADPEDDIPQIADALQQWFISQSIEPGIAACAMVYLMAEQLVYKSRELNDLKRASQEMHALLIMEIVGHLRHA